MEWCIHSSGIIFDLPIIYQHIQFLILPHPLTCSTYSSWTWGGLHQCPSTRHFVASRRIFFFSSLFTYPPTNDLIYHLHLCFPFLIQLVYNTIVFSYILILDSFRHIIDGFTSSTISFRLSNFDFRPFALV